MVCGEFRDGCGEFASVLVGAFLEGVCAGESVVPGVGGKCAGVLAGNVFVGGVFVEVVEFRKRLPQSRHS